MYTYVREDWLISSALIMQRPMIYESSKGSYMNMLLVVVFGLFPRTSLPLEISKLSYLQERELR